jgi:BON domain
VAAFRTAPWASPVTVTVRGGIVELSGMITDQRERKALVVVAENAAGVKEVHDHLVWVEPYSGVAFSSPEDEAKAQARQDARA